MPRDTEVQKKPSVGCEKTKGLTNTKETKTRTGPQERQAAKPSTLEAGQTEVCISEPSPAYKKIPDQPRLRSKKLSQERKTKRRGGGK